MSHSHLRKISSGFDCNALCSNTKQASTTRTSSTVLFFILLYCQRCSQWIFALLVTTVFLYLVFQCCWSFYNELSEDLFSVHLQTRIVKVLKPLNCIRTEVPPRFLFCWIHCSKKKQCYLYINLNFIKENWILNYFIYIWICIVEGKYFSIDEVEVNKFYME